MPPAGKSARTANTVISSRENRWLKEFRVALRGGLPTESGAVGVEGVRLAEEALSSGCRIEAVLFSESGRRHHARLAPYLGREEIAFPILYTTDRLFEGIADTEHPQGVAALVEPRKVSFDELLAGNEGGGLPEEVERSADARIRIPRSGGIKPLNAAAAAAVLFYEAARQRNTLPI